MIEPYNPRIPQPVFSRLDQSGGAEGRASLARDGPTVPVSAAVIAAVQRWLRHALQDGNPRQAARTLAKGSHQIPQINYQSPRAVNARDIGTLGIEFEERTVARFKAINANTGGAILKTGRIIDLFGFLDIGNHEA